MMAPFAPIKASPGKRPTRDGFDLDSERAEPRIAFFLYLVPCTIIEQKIFRSQSLRQHHTELSCKMSVACASES
jgi:hypothetical protein